MLDIGVCSYLLGNTTFMNLVVSYIVHTSFVGEVVLLCFVRVAHFEGNGGVACRFV